MGKSIPWRTVAAIAAGVLVVTLSFQLPKGTESNQEAGAQQVSSASDGAVIAKARDSVTTPPLEQSSVDIPIPAPGEKPKQLVVVSIDGGCETSGGVMTNLLDVAQTIQARITFFITGLCLLPDQQRNAYNPPNRPRGSSDLPFADASMVERRVEVFDRMYREGHEIATHFLGHFCGPSGVGSWSSSDWDSEFAQSKKFIDNWAKYNPQAADAPTLSFDSSVFKGGRTPCLEGDRPQMHRSFADAGFRYEASDPGSLKWPEKQAKNDLWLFPLPAIKLAGTEKWVLSMDYNLLVNQNNGEVNGSKETCQRVEKQTYDTMMMALEGVYEGNRAPLVIGSHLNNWLCGAYIKSLHQFMRDAAEKYPDVEFVSFQDLADWLDEMPKSTLSALQKLEPERY